MNNNVFEKTNREGVQDPEDIQRRASELKHCVEEMMRSDRRVKKTITESRAVFGLYFDGVKKDYQKWKKYK